MKAMKTFLIGGVGLAAMAAAAPAAAQYYPGNPGYGYGGQYGGQYGYGNRGVLGGILDQILGGRSYAHNQRYLVEQCVRAVEHRINTRGLDNERGRYRNYGYGYGYNNQYRNYNGARVVSVTDVRRRSDGRTKVYGYANTGRSGQYGWGSPYGHQGYGYDRQGYGNYGYQMPADARFDCTFDRYGRLRDIDAKRHYAQTYPYRRY